MPYTEGGQFSPELGTLVREGLVGYSKRTIARDDDGRRRILGKVVGECSHSGLGLRDSNMVILANKGATGDIWRNGILLGEIWIANQHNLLGRTRGAGVKFGLSRGAFVIWRYSRS